MVSPGTSRTPPVITSPTSPAEWAPTTVIEREKCMVEFGNDLLSNWDE